MRSGVRALVGQLYGIERTANDRRLDASARQRLRQAQARPVLETLRVYLQEQQATALPKSPLGAAVGYTLRNWRALTRYTDDGRLRVDNNGAYAARGISPVMPRPGLCRVTGGQRSELRRSPDSGKCRSRHSQMLSRNARRRSVGRKRAGTVPEGSACWRARSFS